MHTSSMEAGGDSQARLKPKPSVEKPLNSTRILTSEAKAIMELPMTGDGTKARVISLPESVIGSEMRQKQIEASARSPEELNRELHTAELSAEWVEPGSQEVHATRQFSYLQTPDGRVHSNTGIWQATDKKFAKNGEKKIEEKRIISADGRVTSNQRIVEKTDGSLELGMESVSYDAQGNVTDRSYSLTINGKKVYTNETTLDPADPKKIIKTVLLESRPGFSTKPGDKFSLDGGDDFRNPFSGMKLLES